VVQTKRMTGKDSGTAGSWHTQYHKCGIINVRFFPWGFWTHFFFCIDLLRREISVPLIKTCRTSSRRINYIYIIYDDDLIIVVGIHIVMYWNAHHVHHTHSQTTTDADSIFDLLSLSSSLSMHYHFYYVFIHVSDNLDKE